METDGKEQLDLDQKIAKKEEEIRKLQQQIDDTITQGGKVDSLTFDLVEIHFTELQKLRRKKDKKNS